MCPSPPIPTTPTRDDGRTPWFLQRRRIDRDSPTKQGSDVLALQNFLAQGSQNLAVHSALHVRIAAIPANAGRLRSSRTEVFIALATPLADATAIGLPTDANTVSPTLRSRHLAAEPISVTVPTISWPGNKWILADAPIVVDQVNVAMTDTAQWEILISTSFGFKLFDPHRLVCQKQMSSSRMSGQTMDLFH